MDLPEDVLILILRELDFRSQYQLSQTCSYFERIMCYRGLVTRCDLSRSTMATAQSFKHHLFLQVAPSLQELILCGIPDLHKKNLLPVIGKLKHLKTIDVSYTNITIPDMVEAHRLCPTIKNMSLNFIFTRAAFIPEQMLLQAIRMLAKLENLSFVGSPENLVFSHLPLYLLSEAKNLKNVKLTAIDCDHSRYRLRDYRKVIHCQNLSIYLFDWFEKDGNTSYNYFVYDFMHVFKDLDDFEFIMIKRDASLKYCQFYASHIFRSFIEEHFAVGNRAKRNLHTCLEEFTLQRLRRNAMMMFFDKSRTTFDEAFFAKILVQIKEYFPQSTECPLNHLKDITTENVSCHITVTPPRQQAPGAAGGAAQPGPEPKRLRTGPPAYELKFDGIVKDKQSVKLNIQFMNILNPITMSPANQFLSKTTFLALAGDANYSDNFFKVLLQGATVLTTLSIDTPTVNEYSERVAKALKFCKSLRNFKYVEKGIHYKAMMKGLSECAWLENIHLSNSCFLDLDARAHELADVALLVQKCYKLYSIYIQSNMLETTKKALMKKLNKAKQKYRKPYLNIDIDMTQAFNRYGPFSDDFNLNAFQYPHF